MFWQKGVCRALVEREGLWGSGGATFGAGLWVAKTPILVLSFPGANGFALVALHVEKKLAAVSRGCRPLALIRFPLFADQLTRLTVVAGRGSEAYCLLC